MKHLAAYGFAGIRCVPDTVLFAHKFHQALGHRSAYARGVGPRLVNCEPAQSEQSSREGPILLRDREVKGLENCLGFRNPSARRHCTIPRVSPTTCSNASPEQFAAFARLPRSVILSRGGSGVALSSVALT